MLRLAYDDSYIGRTGVGTLSIDGGSLLYGRFGSIGSSAGSAGTVTVSGDTSSWINGNYLYVGDFGSGTLNIQAGGRVSAAFSHLAHGGGSSGTATVSGRGSTWVNGGDLEVGSSGSGTLSVDAGGQVSSWQGYIGRYAGSIGTATISGAESVWTSSNNLYVGDFGSGVLRIEAGGQVSNKNAYLGYRSTASATATVSGTGSTWTNNGQLWVGADGRGTLTVTDGGLVTAQTLFATLSDLYGNGTITAHGAVLDADLEYDESHGAAQARAFGSGGTLNLTVNGGTLGVGYKGSGSLRITEGVTISSSQGYLGYHIGSMGTATVSGTGTTWINSGNLFVGRDGSGTLTVTDGGLVAAKTLFASLSDLYGNGKITLSEGAVLDADLVFDSSHGTTQTLTFGSGGVLNLIVNGGGDLGVGYKRSGCLRIVDGVALKSVYGRVGCSIGSSGTATVSGAGSAWTSSASLYVGLSGSGTLSVEAGGQVSSNFYSTLAHNAGSTGWATVSGLGSAWINDGDFYVGRFGSGTLTIKAGGQVSNSGHCTLGDFAGSAGTIIVCEAGSMWTNDGDFTVGFNGRGALIVADGGLVNARVLWINKQSTVRLHVSGDDMLVLGNATTVGLVSNYGVISLYADVFLPTGGYRPISEYAKRYIIGLGSSDKAVGGTWDSTVKMFIVASPTSLPAGMSDTLTTGERLLFTDDLTGQRVGASFGSITGSVNCSAAPTSEADLARLAAVLEGRVLSAWDFTTNFSGDEAMLSFDIGTGAEDLVIWRCSDGVWSQFTPSLFTYDGNGIASFTVSSFSGYAVTAAVPEPASLGLLAFAGSMFLTRRRRQC